MRGGGDPPAAAVRRWPSLADDPEVAGAPAAPRGARVALAGYEVEGPIRNGGIGTATSALARALAEDGHDVELVFTGWPDDPSHEAFELHRRRYAEEGIQLDRIDLDTVRGHDGVLYNAAHSLALYDLLRRRDRERPYDVLHFAESLGHGFYSLAARRQGLAFGGATTVVGVHSPRRWLAEAHGRPFDDLIEIGDDFLERRCVELADVVLAPSAHMLDWMSKRRFNLPERSFVQQYVTGYDALPVRGADERVRELVFFGRLESRKGLFAFCDALDELASAGDGCDLEAVTFLGKQVDLWGILSGDYVKERSRRWPWRVEVIDSLDRQAALDYLAGAGRLAVMASTMDNSPNTVYEALGLGVPFLAARTGGTAELVHPDDVERVTYAPGDPERQEIDPGDLAATRPTHGGRPLAAALRRALAKPSGPPARFAVAPAANRDVHLAWHRAAAARATSPPHAAGPPPAVSLCHGSGAERVKAVEAAEHDLVLLVDEGVEPAPGLASTLAAIAAARPQSRFLVPLGRVLEFRREGRLARTYLPTGGPVATALLGNCLGAGVVLAPRDALLRLMPTADPVPLVETFELLARAVLAGERVEVVPEILFERSDERAAEPPLSALPDPLRRLRPFVEQLPDGTSDLAAVVTRQAQELGPARLEADAARAEAQAALEALAVVKASRSWRMAAPLRRGAARARALRRR